MYNQFATNHLDVYFIIVYIIIVYLSILSNYIMYKLLISEIYLILSLLYDISKYNERIIYNEGTLMRKPCPLFDDNRIFFLQSFLAFYDSNGTVLWSVTVTRTFTYNGSTLIQTSTKTVKLSCSKNGTLS